MITHKKQRKKSEKIVDDAHPTAPVSAINMDHRHSGRRLYRDIIIINNHYTTTLTAATVNFTRLSKDFSRHRIGQSIL
jgi:hypothetical protein